MKLPKPINKIVTTVANSVSQTSGKDVDDSFSMAENIDVLSRQAAAESIVLLKNDGVLPLREEECISLFGRVQSDTFFVGYGSGGDVKPHYKVSFTEGLKNAGVNINSKLLKVYDGWRKKNVPDDGFWGNWPMCYDEMHIDYMTALRAADESDKALVFIGRAAGEDRENTLTAGSYYLTDEEKNMLKTVSLTFSKWAVVLNIGNIIDFSWIEEYKVPAVMIVWQGGMEAGNGFADVVTGKVSPCGALTDTVAKTYEDYPSSENFGGKDRNTYTEDIYVGYRYFETFEKDKVLFPFGFGLSYTDFEIKPVSFTKENAVVKLSVCVKNIGSTAGKRPVGIYLKQTDSEIAVPEAALKAFGKTRELLPGEEEILSFSVSHYDMASYDDSGITGNKSCYVLSKGEYSLEAGFNVRDTVNVGKFSIEKTEIVQKLKEVSATEPANAFTRLRPMYSNGKIYKTYESAPVRTVSLKAEIEKNLPPTVNMSVGLHYTLDDVKAKKITMDEFISTLSYDELEAISRGDYVMNSPLGAKGNAGVFGGVLPSLREKGIAPITTTDGPSGIRIAAYSALFPCGTALASTWNCTLVRDMYALLGKEMRERGSDVLLAPGMNIHRNPLCGRNFEYFSEDPLVAGFMAAAVTEGLQSSGVSACPKHFACNNQEVRRTKNNSVLSERALREIYLKGFEICVKRAQPLNIMTSYNKINGVWGHYNYDLVTSVLRGEWCFDGCVMTDWWMQSSSSPEFPVIRDQAYRVRAGVNVLMPGGNRAGTRKPDGTLLASMGKEGGITTGEMQKNAAQILNMILKLESLR